MTAAANVTVELIARPYMGRHQRLAALALGGLADVALDSSAGYSVTTAQQVADVVGLARSTTDRTLRELAAVGLVIVVASFAGVRHHYTGPEAVRLPRGARVLGYRLTEELLNR